MMARISVRHSGGSLKTVGARSPDPLSLASAGGAAAGLAIAYFLAAKLGLALQAQPSDVAVFWPASGIAAGLLIIAGRRAYPALLIGIVIGTVAANILNDRSLWTSVLKGLCNSGEAALVAVLLERWFGPRFTFGDVNRVVGFLAAALAATAASGVAGATTMTLLHTTAPFSDVWRDWFLADGVGLVVVAPFVIGLGEVLRQPPSRREWAEGLGVLALLIAVSIHVVSHPSQSWLSFSPGAAVLPFLLWLVARCPPTFAIAGAFFASAAVICATNFGIGRFGDAAIPISERVRGAQTAVMTVTVYTLALVALFAAKSRGERLATQGLQRYRLALDGAQLGTLSTNLGTGQLECDLRAASMHGHSALPTTIGEFRRFVLPEDIVHIDAAAAGAHASGGVWNAEYRVVLPPNHPNAGETWWVAVECSVTRDAEGIPTALIGVTRDITSRKLAERALSERNLQLSLAGKAALVGTFAYDVDADTIQISDGYAAIHGFPDGTTEIKRSEWRAGVHPEDLGRVEELRSRTFRHRRKEYNKEYRIFLSGGETRWIESRGFVSYRSNGQPQRVVGVNIDATHRKRAEEHQRTLLAELDHRVKNVLATVSAIIIQSPKTDGSLPDYVARLDKRIKSLARTHELLSDRSWHGVSLEAIARCELAPYLESNAEIEGPHVELKADAAQAVSMVIHELATNAAKHGVFSSQGGRLLLCWRWLENGSRGWLAIEWQEVGGPPVRWPNKAGYGTSIILELVPYELGGTVDLDFASGGLYCRLEVPADCAHGPDRAHSSSENLGPKQPGSAGREHGEISAPRT